MNIFNLQGDKTIWGVVFCLFTLSVLVVYSTAGLSYLFNHFSIIVLGLICMYIIHNLKFNIYTTHYGSCLWIETIINSSRQCALSSSNIWVIAHIISKSEKVVC